METEKTDLFALNKAEYAATRRPRLVTVDAGWFLCIEGSGHPSGEEFRVALECLYACAYSLRAAAKAAGREYALSKLEGLWHLDPGYFDIDSAPHHAWNWTLLLRTPDFLGENDLEPVKQALLAKGKPRETGQVGFMGFEEGLCAQILHVGPYDQEAPTLAVLRSFIEKKGLTVVGRHHEIYLSDPRRTAPEKLRTIIRLPVV